MIQFLGMLVTKMSTGDPDKDRALHKRGDLVAWRGADHVWGPAEDKRVFDEVTGGKETWPAIFVIVTVTDMTEERLAELGWGEPLYDDPNDLENRRVIAPSAYRLGEGLVPPEVLQEMEETGRYECDEATITPWVVPV